MDELPEEILEHILSGLSPYNDLIAASQVNKLWNRIVLGIIIKRKNDVLHAAQEGLFDVHLLTKPGTPIITDRYSHCACYMDKGMYVFGGCTSPNATFNDLWKFDLSTRQWIRVIGAGQYPSPKACCSMVVYKKKLVLFGGWSHPTPYPLHQAAKFFSELHTYCYETNLWTHVAIITNPCPPPTAGHSACVVGDKMVVFGGSHGHNSSCNDIWVLDLINMSWMKKETSDPKPRPRYGQTMLVIDDEHILVLGGCGGPNMVYSDAWLLNLTGRWHWTEITINNVENAPTQLWCRSVVKVNDKLVMFSRGTRQSREKSNVQLRAVESKNILPPPEPPSQPVWSCGCAHRGDSTSSDTDSSGSADEMNPTQRRRPSRPRCVCVNSPPIMGPPQSSQAPRSTPSRRLNPSVRPNAMSNRERQLLVLSHYEDIIRAKAAAANKNNEGGQTTNRTSFFLHSLDLSKLFSDNTLSWLLVGECPLSERSTSNDELLFYSLVQGRGELILFGGLRTNPGNILQSMGPNSVVVSNDLYVLTPSAS